jgi:aconitate hydratase
LKVEDNITTDHIMPAGAKILPLRSNIPAISEYVFSVVDEEFVTRAKEYGGGFIVGGDNYGQGSSREHAALAPMYLKVKAVLVKSFARIHRANLINFGIIPLTFVDGADYDGLEQDQELRLSGLTEGLEEGKTLEVENVTTGGSFRARADLSRRQIEIVAGGGLLNYTKAQG